jgi:hypothetical protein
VNHGDARWRFEAPDWRVAEVAGNGATLLHVGPRQRIAPNIEGGTLVRTS